MCYKILNRLVLIGLSFYSLSSFTNSAIHPKHLRHIEIPFQELQTPKGLKVLFFENSKTPQVSLYIGFKKSGIAYDPPGKRGLAWIVASFLQEKLEQRKSAFTPFFQQQEMQLKFYEQAAYDQENFVIELTSSITHLSTALSLLTDCLRQPYNLKSQFKKILQMKIAAISHSLKNPDAIANFTFSQLIINRRPDSSLPVNPSESFFTIQEKDIIDYIQENLSNISENDVREYMQAHFTRENLVVGAAGSIKPDQLMLLLDESLGKLPVKSLKTVVDMQSPTISDQPKKAYIFKDIPGSVIYFGQPWKTKTYREHYATELLKTQLWVVIIQYFKQVLGVKHLNTNYYHEMQHINDTILGGYLYTENALTTQFIQLIRAVFNKTKTSEFHQTSSDQLIEKLKKRVTLKQHKKSLTASLLHLSTQIKFDNGMAAFYLFNLQTNALRFLATSSAISCLQQVQPKDINHIAHELLDADKLSWIEVGKENHLQTVSKHN